MKRILAALLLAVCGMALHAQATFTPSAMTAMCFSSTLGKWVPAAALASGTAATYTPQSVALYGNNGASYYPLQCDSSGNLTLSNGGLMAQFLSVTAIATSTVSQAYYVGAGGAAGTSGAAVVIHWKAPRACTLTSGWLGLDVTGTKDSTANNWTLKVYNATTSTAYADTAVSVTAQTTAPQNSFTASDAVAANDELVLQFTAPGLFGTTPTNVYFAGNIFCK